jgi:hypothetical protein
MVGIGDGDPLISLRFSDTVSEGVLEGQLRRSWECRGKVERADGTVPQKAGTKAHETIDDGVWDARMRLPMRADSYRTKSTSPQKAPPGFRYQPSGLIFELAKLTMEEDKEIVREDRASEEISSNVP